MVPCTPLCAWTQKLRGKLAKLVLGDSFDAKSRVRAGREEMGYASEPESFRPDQQEGSPLTSSVPRLPPLLEGTGCDAADSHLTRQLQQQQRRAKKELAFGKADKSDRCALLFPRFKLGM